MKILKNSLPLFILLVFGLALLVGSCECDDDDDDNDDNDSGDEILSDDEELKNDGVDDPPPFSIDPERPAADSSVTVTVDVPDASLITLTVTGAGCGTLYGTSGPSPLVVTGVTPASGYCSLSADADGEILQGFFEIQASDADLPPVNVPGASYKAGALPTPTTDTGSPVITGVTGPETFINGGTASYTVDYSGVDVTHALIEVVGYPGYYVLPVDAAGGQLEFSLAFDLDIFDQLTTKANTVQFNMSLIDVLGRVADLLALALDGVEVQYGDVKVSLSWDTMTDVDLHVYEPSGEEIYYGHSTSATGGQLDLDSNAGCSIDGINNENIFWPEGQSPTGDYTVMAHMWSDCEVGYASGTVTMSFCGEQSPLVEYFSLGATGSSESWTFTSECAYRVSGTIKYEDFAITQSGLSSTGTMVPVRFATVDVVREADDEVLGSSVTDARGKYQIDFANDGDPGVYVRVMAYQSDATLRQSVSDLSGAVYAWRAKDSYNEQTAQIKTGYDLEITKAERAGALNIWEVGVTCAETARTYGGKTPSMVSFLWEQGVKPLGKASSFATRDNKIYILGMASDPDEYDDIIIGHEYGHVVQRQYSTNDSPGGSHSSNKQSVPTLAFSEGWATYFGITANKVTSYMDTNKNGMGVFYSLETLPSSKPLGNKDDKLEGKLSEAVVAAVLLDLDDATNETKDTISSKTTAIWTIMTSYLKEGYGKFHDRGVAGRDLVDFLDGWFCLGFGDEGDNTKGVKGNVKGLHKLSYDFKNLDSCK
ncbi:MAG TPA: hypothetical protein PKW95_08070 [bacterium]|nr:hypothetical protein [bacterium]